MIINSFQKQGRSQDHTNLSLRDSRAIHTKNLWDRPWFMSRHLSTITLYHCDGHDKTPRFPFLVRVFRSAKTNIFSVSHNISIKTKLTWVILLNFRGNHSLQWTHHAQQSKQWAFKYSARFSVSSHQIGWVVVAVKRLPSPRPAKLWKMKSLKRLKPCLVQRDTTTPRPGECIPESRNIDGRSTPRMEKATIPQNLAERTRPSRPGRKKTRLD